MALCYYRARYYDSQIGRFISEDPIGFYGGLNRFSYVANGPEDDSDPSGLKKKKPHANPKPPTCDAVFPQDPTTARLAQLVYGEGNGTAVGDLAVASVVANRANYGNPKEFGTGIMGAINKGFDATGNALFNSVSSPSKCKQLDPANCQRYKNALLAAIAVQAPDGIGTNTDAEFYFGANIDLPAPLKRGLKEGYIVPAPIAGQTGPGSNYLDWGTYGYPLIFFKYTDYNH